jgi:hypothetical protein
MTHASKMASSASVERFFTDINRAAATNVPSHPEASAAEKIMARLLHLSTESVNRRCASV